MEMKRFICYGLCLVGIAFSLTACSEDKGNYDYHDLQELNITGLESDLPVQSFSRLVLTPSLGENARPDDQYDFEWKAINQNESQEVTILGQNRTLDYEVRLAPGIYTLYFTATEKDTGIFWQTHGTLTVSDTTSEGWMVLCSDEGRARLDIVSDVTGETYHDILKDNGMPTFYGPRKIQWLPGMSDENSPYYLLTDDGATRLGVNGFEWKEEYDFAYENATSGPFAPHSFSVSGFGKMYVSNAKAYYCENMGIEGLYGSPINKDFSAAPIVGANVAASQVYAAVYMIYDVDNKQFMGYCPLLTAIGGINPLLSMEDMSVVASSIAGEDGVTGAAFEDFPHGYDFVYMENTKYDPNNGLMGTTYTILADGDQRYLYGIQLGDMMLFADCTYVLGKAYYGDLSACTDITNENNLYAFSSLYNCMYYAVGNTVYRVDLSSLPLKAERQFTLDNETITCLKFNIYQREENSSRSYDLVVGSVNADNEGFLRIYEGMESGGNFQSAVPAQTYTGFARIVDATYRELTY